MDTLIDCGLFVVGLIIGIYFFRYVFFPIIYCLPKSLWWVFRRKLKPLTPLLFLGVPLFGITLIVFIIFFLDLFDAIAGSFAYGLGLHMAVGFLLLRSIFSSSERTKMKDVFEDVVAEYRLDNPRVFK